MKDRNEKKKKKEKEKKKKTVNHGQIQSLAPRVHYLSFFSKCLYSNVGI